MSQGGHSKSGQENKGVWAFAAPKIEWSLKWSGGGIFVKVCSSEGSGRTFLLGVFRLRLSLKAASPCAAGYLSRVVFLQSGEDGFLDRLFAAAEEGGLHFIARLASKFDESFPRNKQDFQGLRNFREKACCNKSVLTAAVVSWPSTV